MEILSEKKHFFFSRFSFWYLKKGVFSAKNKITANSRESKRTEKKWIIRTTTATINKRYVECMCATIKKCVSIHTYTYDTKMGLARLLYICWIRQNEVIPFLYVQLSIPLRFFLRKKTLCIAEEKECFAEGKNCSMLYIFLVTVVLCRVFFWKKGERIRTWKHFRHFLLNLGNGSSNSQKNCCECEPKKPVTEFHSFSERDHVDIIHIFVWNKKRAHNCSI